MTRDPRGAVISIRFSILGSGSSGNSTLVEADGSRILLDCGLSLRETERRLERIGRRIDQIDAVLLTHEHEDHSRGLEALLKRQPAVVAATRGTLRALRDELPDGAERLELRAGSAATLGALEVVPFRVPHDAAEPVGFRIGHGGARLGHVTDLGHLSDEVREGLSDLTAMVVESNHDIDMLRAGPYPPRLKKRILGRYGHLSNEMVHEWLREAALDGCELLYLTHLSRTNNRPEIAAASAALALAGRSVQPEIKISLPFEPTPIESAVGRPRVETAAVPEPAPPSRQQLHFIF